MEIAKRAEDAPVFVRAPGNPGQARAHLEVRAGGFSVGAFAASNRGKLRDFYLLEPKVIGEGAYGTVQRCQVKDTGQWRAVKAINRALVRDSGQFREEMAIMKLLDHPNIVRLYETFEEEDRVFLVLELCTGGELFDRILADGKFTEQAAAVCVQQMLRAVNYMHQNYIMHRDLKPENWLLATAEESISKAVLKLIDFGLSKRFTPGEFASTKAGTPYYVAPEVLDGRATERSDVWSIGVIMYILLSGNPPFAGANTASILSAVRRAEARFDQEEWALVSQEAKRMLANLLAKDPFARVSAAAALEHPWLRQMSQSQSAGQKPQAPITLAMVSNLRSFSTMNKLKKAALNVIATQQADQDIRDLKASFEAMDKDNDGTLTLQELKEGLRRAGVDVTQDLARMMETMDTDGSGVVDYSEFMAATLDRQRYMQEELIWRAFKTFDLDGSNTIERQELEKLLGSGSLHDALGAKLTACEIDAILKEVDLDGDGKIDFPEFLAMMRNGPLEGKSSGSVG